MNFGNKDFKEYWKLIKIPTYILIAWSIAGFILSIISFDLYITIFSGSTSLLLTIAVFAFIGWTVIKDHKETVKTAAWSGALSGAISGVIGAVIGILMFYLVPGLTDFAVSQAVQSGADASMIQGFMAIGIYIGLITGPLISGLIGAAVSSISALIAKKVGVK